MIREAIILAGGLGTRLREAVPDLPKPLAPVSGKPFLEYILEYLNFYSIERVIISVGYKKDEIMSQIGKSFKDIDIVYAEEHEPLGTGGGIMKAMEETIEDEIFLINGDTFFRVDLFEFYSFHIHSGSDFSLSLKYMADCTRYGTVELKSDRIIKFLDKGQSGPGYINGGIYILNKDLLYKQRLPSKFSFEKDFIETKLETIVFKGYCTNDYFIDIGIPEDYERAQTELPGVIDLMLSRE